MEDTKTKWEQNTKGMHDDYNKDNFNYKGIKQLLKKC